MPKIIFHKLVPVEVDVPDHCPKCGACLHGPLRDERGEPVTQQMRYDTSGDSSVGSGRGPLNGLAWDASSFVGRLTGKSGAGDDDEVIETNSLAFYSLPTSRLMRIECAACHWAIEPGEEKKPTEGHLTCDSCGALVRTPAELHKALGSTYWAGHPDALAEHKVDCRWAARFKGGE